MVGIQTGCCPLPVPMTLHFSVTGGGICNGSYAITYDPLVPAGWIFVGPFGNCTSLRTEVLRCNANGSWHVTTPATLGGDVFLFTCTPLAITLIGQDMTPCGGTAGATVTVTT